MSYKVNVNCLQCSLAFVYLLLCLPAFSQKKPAIPLSPYDFGTVDQLLKQNPKSLGPNFAALIWKDGKPVYEKTGGPDFTAKSQAPIAGAGNWLTAALVMTYVDEGKLSLDDKVSKYIPLFANYSKGYITIRNCLTNTTGIRASEDEPMKVMPRLKSATLEDEVNSYASKRDIATNPGTEFFYSVVGPNIAARVLEIITKKSFDRLMNERMLRPLKMRGTSFSNDDGGAVDASSGARSTANDYMNFLTMLLNKGQFGGKRILSERAVQEMETAQFTNLPAKFAPKGMQGVHYGLGAWIIEASAADTATALSCPDFVGTTPFIDKCRGYAAILMVEKPVEDQKKLSQSMKGLIDAAIGGGCQ